ncbi:MAG: tetratricopeptide repeat protein [Proteobacteria bacterium]|nr:tetratricopeptide repeat protein [Pseudomonadota bacterium]
MTLIGTFTANWKIIAIVASCTVILAACATLDQKSATAYFEEGASLVQKGKINEGIEKYKKGLRKEPRSSVGYNYLAIAYRRKYEQLRSLDWREKEIEAFKKSIEMDPNFYLPYVNLGKTYYDMGRFKEAAFYLKKGLEVFPEHPSRELIENMIREGEREGK